MRNNYFKRIYIFCGCIGALSIALWFVNQTCKKKILKGEEKEEEEDLILFQNWNLITVFCKLNITRFLSPEKFKCYFSMNER